MAWSVAFASPRSFPFSLNLEAFGIPLVLLFFCFRLYFPAHSLWLLLKTGIERLGDRNLRPVVTTVVACRHVCARSTSTSFRLTSPNSLRSHLPSEAACCRPYVCVFVCVCLCVCSLFGVFFWLSWRPQITGGITNVIFKARNAATGEGALVRLYGKDTDLLLDRRCVFLFRR